MDIGNESPNTADILNLERERLKEEIKAMNKAFRDLESEREVKMEATGQRLDWINLEIKSKFLQQQNVTAPVMHRDNGTVLQF